MRIETTRFGALDVDESSIITFPEGLPGFEDSRQFTLIPHHPPGGDKTTPFEWLQSVEDGALAFLAMDPRQVFTTYAPRVPDSELESISLGRNAPEPRVYSLLTVPKGEPCGITANLLAPVLVNPAARLAKQVVLSSDEYGLRHRLIPD